MVRYSFPGKVVLVTGSSRGMGAAILEAFAGAGATCIVNYFDDPDGYPLELVEVAYYNEEERRAGIAAYLASRS